MRGAPTLLDRLSRRGRRALRAGARRCSTTPASRYELDPTLVRGLDYYTRTVFEFTSDALGAQSGVGGGGRYDRPDRAARRAADPGLRLGGRRRADAARRGRAAGRARARRPVRRAADTRSGRRPDRVRARSRAPAAPASPPSSSSPAARSRASSSTPTGSAPATLRSSDEAPRRRASRTWSPASSARSTCRT